jgi:hypothetical protein
MPCNTSDELASFADEHERKQIHTGKRIKRNRFIHHFE